MMLTSCYFCLLTCWYSIVLLVYGEESDLSIILVISSATIYNTTFAVDVVNSAINNSSIIDGYTFDNTVIIDSKV